MTNRTWEEFWLNEGFTVFLERKILGRLYGEPVRQFNCLCGWKALKDSVEHFGHEHPFTALHTKLDDIDPDDAFSSVPYERGSQFLIYLESLVGSEAFEKFLKAWVSRNIYGTVTAAELRAFFEEFFAAQKPQWEGKVDWNAWLSQPGMPPVDVLPLFDQTLAKEGIALAERWISTQGEGCSSTDLAGWTSGQITYFLDKILLAPDLQISPETLDKMDKLYAFNSSKNSEIRFRWYSLAIRAHAVSIFPNIAGFLKEQGRMKFTRPLYRDLFNLGGSVGKELALATFAECRPNYHSITAKMVSKDLLLDQ